MRTVPFRLHLRLSRMCKRKSLHMSQVAHQAGAYPGFCSMKRRTIRKWRWCLNAAIYSSVSFNHLVQYFSFYNFFGPIMLETTNRQTRNT